MKLIRIIDDANNYINADFLVRVWRENDKQYCQLVIGTTYQISKNALIKIVNLDIFQLNYRVLVI